MIPFLMTANGAGVEHNNIYAREPKKGHRPYRKAPSALYRSSAELT
jgi:hypothetical protein